MSSAQAAARLQQKTEELAAASIRALAGERELQYRGHRLHRRGRPLPLFAAHLHPSLEHDSAASFRGAADGLALRLLRSDRALHEVLSPAEPGERAIFELLEQYRCESLVPPALAGVRANLRRRHDAWSLGFHHAGHTETAAGLLLYTVAQVCRARVTGDPVVEETEDLLEATRAGLSPLIGTALAGLRRERADQRAYAVHALAIARCVAGLLAAAGATPRTEAAADRDEAVRRVFGFLLEPEGPLGERLAGAVGTGPRLAAVGRDEPYRIYTTRYDREDDARTLARPALLAELRDRLDGLVEASGVHRGRLVRELGAVFAVPRRDGWDGELEEGLIDGRRLARLVASPQERRLFRRERHEPHADAALAFLVDCSGSMKAHADAVAVLVDSFARALEQVGVACEVLGFSTAAWNGGQARRDWLRAGSPPSPGRLNERAHIVFKPGDVAWRHGRRGIAALLKPDLYREGIDGEAVDWACARLDARAEPRRMLVVVSDGSPMDGATRLANDAGLLDRHLRAVVERHERAGRIEIRGLGVGLDLSAAYRTSRVLELGGAPGGRVFREVVDLIAGRRL